MEQNSYIAIYLSNEEQMDVYLDNLSITHQRGRLLEEQHYYPHGLLSGKSVAAGATPENKFQYQGNRMQGELGMELYDFHARQYDPQTGRFLGVDPLVDVGQGFLSPYQFCFNDPANFVDPLGLMPDWGDTGCPRTPKPDRTDRSFLGKVGDGASSTMESIFDYFARIQIGYSSNGLNDGESSGIPMQGATAAMLGYSGTAAGSGYGGSGGTGGSGGSSHWLVTHSGGARSAPQPGIRFNEREYKQATFTRAAAFQVGVSRENRRVGQESGGDWYGPAGRANVGLAAAALGLEHTPGSFRMTNGAYNGSALSPKYYASGWGGGSRARITTYNIGKIGRTLGHASAIAGVFMDGVGMRVYRDNPNSVNAVHPGKAGLNTGMSAYGIWINGPAALLYFGVDAFHPGGWPGFMQGVGDMNVDLQQHYGPDFRLIPFGPK